MITKAEREAYLREDVEKSWIDINDSPMQSIYVDVNNAMSSSEDEDEMDDNDDQSSADLLGASLGTLATGKSAPGAVNSASQRQVSRSVSHLRIISDEEQRSLLNRREDRVSKHRLDKSDQDYFLEFSPTSFAVGLSLVASISFTAGYVVGKRTRVV